MSYAQILKSQNQEEQNTSSSISIANEFKEFMKQSMQQQHDLEYAIINLLSSITSHSTMEFQWIGPAQTGNYIFLKYNDT